MDTTTVTSAPASASAAPHTLDGLSRLSARELGAIYANAGPPASMRDVDGLLAGRMLAVRAIPGALAEPLRRWARSRAFVWDGKTFEARSDERGRGHNRVFGGPVLGRQILFPFATSFGPSAVDGAPTLILDYDLPENPAYIRHIHDEIREVSPGVFLGPAMWRRRAERVHVLWFALDRSASRPAS
jgi:hypothetical protein